MPQAVDQRTNLTRAARIVTRDVVKPPVTHASHLFQQIGLQIDHPVAPAVGGFGLAGMQLIRIHRHDRVGRGNVLRAAIAKALGTGFYRANTERFVGVWLKGVA